MKKILLIGLVLASSFMGYAQKTDTLSKSIQKNAEAIGHGGNNEFKINVLFSVIGMPEITYERIFADNMSVGASVLVGLDRSLEYKFAFTPYYRLYFGAKKASGFFIEGNASLVNTESEYYDYSYSQYTSYPGNYNMHYKNRSNTNFGFGAAAGAKFLTRNGFLGEAYLGLVRLLGNNSAEAFPRMGITIGKRF